MLNTLPVGHSRAKQLCEIPLSVFGDTENGFLTICKPDRSPLNSTEFECHFMTERSAGLDLTLNSFACAAESLETVVKAQVGHFRGNGMLHGC